MSSNGGQVPAAFTCLGSVLCLLEKQWHRALCRNYFSPRVWGLFHTPFLISNRRSKIDLVIMGGKEDFCRERST